MPDPFLSEREGLFGVVQSANWSQFQQRYRDTLRAFSPDGPLYGRYLFRGQSCAAWPVWSSFDRLHKDLSPKEKDDLYKSNVERFGRAFKQVEPLNRSGLDARFQTAGDLSDPDKETIGQHYGLPTRLMDWSLSPYVATFFAFSKVADCRSGRVSVWAMDEQGVKHHFSKDALEIREDIHGENQRQLWQVGKFLRNKTNFEDLKDVFAKPEKFVSDKVRKGPPLLIRFDIPTAAFEDAMDDLDMMRINSITLFPGIEGVVRWMNRGGADRLRSGVSKV